MTSIAVHCVGRRPRRSNQNLPILEDHLVHGDRIRSGSLSHFARRAVEPRAVPRALKGAVRQHISQRHLEVLMRAVIGHCTDPVSVPDEADAVTVLFHHSEHSLLGDLVQPGERLEGRDH